MSRLSVHPAPSVQRGLTLIELMISMLLGLIVVGGVLGIFVANSETNRRTDDLARIQENARVAVQFIGRSMREAGGNPCGVPSGQGLIIHNITEDPATNWWSGGKDFASSLWGYAAGGTNSTATSFLANGGVAMVNGSDAVITVSGNSFAKTVISDSPPDGSMTVHSAEGLAAGDILFACSTIKGYGVVFKAGAISKSDTNEWKVARATPFDGAVENMTATTLGRISAEGWFVGKNGRGGTSLFRAFIGDGGKPEEIAPDVSGMTIIYLLPKGNQYVSASAIDDADWPNVIAAYITLTISRRIGKDQEGEDQAIKRTVGLTVNLRNRFNFAAVGGGNDGGDGGGSGSDGGSPP
jgi:type IV pilus assembly protein PilW